MVSAWAAGAQGFGSGDTPESLWLADGAGVVEVTRGSAEVLRQVADSGDARALALDPEREILWHVSNDSLSTLPLTGDPGLSLPLRLEEGQRVFLEYWPFDGSAWVGVGHRVRAYGVTGQLLVEVPLESRLQAWALFPGPRGPGTGEGPRAEESAEGLVWVATGETEGGFSPFAVIAYDLATGQALHRLELGQQDQVTALAADPDSGALWVALANRLARYDGEGNLLEETLFAGGETPVNHLSPDGFGGLWAVRAGRQVADGEAEPARLQRFDGEGSERLSLPILSILPGEDGPLEGSSPEESVRRLALDDQNRTLWVATGRELHRFSAAGFRLSSLDLGSEADLRDLAFGLSEPDTEAPTLTFTAPQEGATLDTARPEVHLSWADFGSGIDPQSLVLEEDGVLLATQCEALSEGAVCLPETDLAEGEVTLSATVADFAANSSFPATVTFSVETETSDDPDDPKPGADPSAYHAIPIERGLEANKVYLTGNDIETISPATGNLSLSIPIGPVYSVGPLISYQIRANYNSSVWQRAIVSCLATDVPCPAGGDELEVMVPNPASNAGLGWEVHFGRLYSSTPPSGLEGLESVLWPNGEDQLSEPSARWLYVAPDGSNHQFYLNANRPSGGLYTKDGSFLRLRQPNGNRVEIHHPTGVTSVFEKSSATEGTLFCGGEVTGCWRFLEHVDPYGNKFSISYSSSGNEEIWTVTDSLSTQTERRHELVFSRDKTKRQGGDGGPFRPFTRSSGDEWGDLRRVLQKVKLASFGGATAEWNFQYKNSRVSRGCPQEGRPTPGEVTELNTVHLWKIDPPSLQPYVFDTSTGTGGSNCSNLSGKVTEVTLPSQGKVRYGWGNWSFPTRCTYRGIEPQIDPKTKYIQLGISTKSRLSLHGALEGTWTYSNSLVGPVEQDPWGPDCDRDDYRVTTVDGPVVDDHFSREVFYTAVSEGPEIPGINQSIDTWQVTDNGLPFTKEISIGTSPANRRFLSRETFHCKVGEACGAAHKRTSVYVRYASEWKPIGPCIKRTGSSVGWATPPE